LDLSPAHFLAKILKRQATHAIIRIAKSNGKTCIACGEQSDKSKLLKTWLLSRGSRHCAIYFGFLAWVRKKVN
jgi:hypothetical protein